MGVDAVPVAEWSAGVALRGDPEDSIVHESEPIRYKADISINPKYGY